MTGDQITYDILEILTKFGFTDDQRYDETWIAYKRDQVRAVLIQDEFRRKGFVNPLWFQDVNLAYFTPVQESDIDYGICGCNCYKAIIPPHITLFNPDSQNEDNGLRLMDPCGKIQYYYYPLTEIQQIPEEHPRAKFNYYWQIGNQLFIKSPVNFNKTGINLRILGVYQNPADVNTINNTVITSGNLVVGTVYKAINYQVVHNSLGYSPGQTFTAVNANYSGGGLAVLNTQVSAYSESTSKYPCSSEMARHIVLEIMLKEFGIEKQQVSDFKNDYANDNTGVTNKAAQV